MLTEEELLLGKPAQIITCVNNGGFVIRFSFEVFDETLLNWRTIDGTQSGDIVLGQTRSTDLSTIPGLSEGMSIRPKIEEFTGFSWNGTPEVVPVQYANNGQTATYVVTGTTFSPQVQMT